MLYHPTYGYVVPLRVLSHAPAFTLCMTRAGELALGTRSLRKLDPYSNLHP